MTATRRVPRARGTSARAASRPLDRARPSAARAAAAARLAGAPAGDKDVAERLLAADRRRKRTTASAAGGDPRSPGNGSPGNGSLGSGSLGSGVPGSADMGTSRGGAPLRAAIGAIGAAALAVPEPFRRPREQPEEKPRHLKVVEKAPPSPAQRRRRARTVVGASIAAAGMVGLALVYLHVVLAQRQFALDDMQSRVQKAQATYQDLRLQVAELSSPQHIITEAEGKLGMIQPTSVVYLPQSGKGTSATTTSATNSLVDASGGRSVVPSSEAPAGDSDWPTIKADLQGVP